MTVFKIFAKFLGIILIISGISTLIFLLIGVFTLGTNLFIEFPWQNFIQAGNFTDYPIWSFGLLMLFAVGIPFFFMTLLGFKLLSPNLKSIGNIAKYTLLALWIISIAILISIGIKQATEVSYENKVVKKEFLNVLATDTLYVKFRYNDYFAKDLEQHSDFEFVQDSANSQLIYSNDVHLHIKYTDEKAAYIQIEKQARGRSFQDARTKAENILYKMTVDGNHIVLDNYFLTDVKNKFRDQEIDVYLYLPEGQLFNPDASVQEYDRSDTDFFDLHFSGNYNYKVNRAKVNCLDCPLDEQERNDDEEWNETTTSQDTVKEVYIKINRKEGHGKLTINKDGIIIKTN